MPPSRGARAQLLVIAAALLVFVVVQVAIAGPSGGDEPRATVASLQSKVKKLTKQVTALRAERGSPRPPTGPAAGDLAGTYPSPTLRPPDAPILAGLPDATTPGDCTGLSTGFYDADPATTFSVGYSRDRTGRVYLQGEGLQCGTPLPAIFTIPAGFRPEKLEAQAAPSPTGVVIVSVNAAGAVGVSGGSDGDSFFLDGLSFPCGPSGANGCP